MIKVTIIFDNEVGTPARHIGIDLGVHSCPHSPLVTAVALDDASDPLFQRSDDHDGLIHKAIVSGFKEQRHDVHDRLPRSGPLLAFQRNAPNMRMQQGVEPVARGGVVKDDIRERGPVQNAVSHDLRPDAPDGQEPVALRSYDLTRDGIGIDDEGAELAQDRGDRALPCPDAAG